jgi:hypothetical protein
MQVGQSRVFLLDLTTLGCPMLQMGQGRYLSHGASRTMTGPHNTSSERRPPSPALGAAHVSAKQPGKLGRSISSLSSIVGIIGSRIIVFTVGCYIPQSPLTRLVALLHLLEVKVGGIS